MSELVDELIRNAKMPDNFLFQNLIVYQRSLAFSIKVCKLASDFPIKYSRIRDQLIGASTSIPLNIAEGSGRKSVKERTNFYNISRSSIFECVPLFEICKNLGLISSDDSTVLNQEAVELSKMISKFIASLSIS